jgi:hypothetical protein
MSPPQNCQEYLRTLCSSITPASLEALPTPTELVVIGCGDPSLINFYAETASCPFPIYAEPTKRLYADLHMARTLNLGHERPAYMQKSLLHAIVASVLQSLRQGRKAFKGGDYWQVGGEFLFEGGRARWCHRMANTRDHAEVPELRRVLGLEPAEIPIRKSWSLRRIGAAGKRTRAGSSRSGSAGSDRTRDGSEDGSPVEGMGPIKEATAGEEDGRN